MDVYVIITEGYTDCALAEAVLQKYMGYQQYGKKGDMPECLQKLVGVYPGELGQLELKDTPHFFYKGEKAVMVKTAEGLTELPKKLEWILEALLSTEESISAVKSVLILCDADRKTQKSNLEKIEDALEHIPEMMLERGKGRLSYNELELSYEIHQIPQNGEGAVEKLLLEMLERIEPELAACAAAYREQIMDDAFEHIRGKWCRDKAVQEFYADKVQLGAALAVLKPDRPVGYAVRDCIVVKDRKQELMGTKEFSTLYQRMQRWLGEM